jgi:N-acyl-D-amino-acid deacylase
MLFDIVIRNATIIDGSGRDRFLGDVGIIGEKIAMVTEPYQAGKGAKEIDATGLILTPGFVDIHTHYDAQATWDPDLTPSSWHGCTTVVMGNCGVGFAPVKPDKHKWLINLMEGVEDIPGTAMHEGIAWSWESFPEYMNALERKTFAMDIGVQIPHGSLRGYVMGDRGARNEDATQEDINQMYLLVKEALIAGALGFSTSRTLLHKSIDGKHVPGTFASEVELFGIAQALTETQSGVFQLAADHLKVPAELPWMKKLALQTQRPVLFNLSQTDHAPELWKEILGQLEGFALEGIPVYGQVAGRGIGLLMNWLCTGHPFALHPSFLALNALSWEEKKEMLQKPEFKAKLLAEEPLFVGDFEKFVTQSFHKMFPFYTPQDYEPNLSLWQMASQKSQNPDEIKKIALEMAYDFMLQDDGKAMLYFPLFNYSHQSLDTIYELHHHPRTIMGLSDAGAHCGAICDGGMPTFMLSYWARDRKTQKFSLEKVVQRQTRDTAMIYGLQDRGLIAQGYRADLNLIDFNALHLEMPAVVFDLPAKGRRLIQKARGYRFTICRGQITVENDQKTNAYPGKLIRGNQAL